jgi:predicted TIM-barrel fold metal-dependent hydrolase
MKIIDFHTHVFPPELAPRAIKLLIDNAAPTTVMKNHTDGTINGLLESMRRGGVDTSVTMAIATKPSQVATINRECVQNQYGGIVRFGTLHPDTEDFAAQINFLAAGGIRGIKFHPEYQTFYITDKKLYPVYEKLAASGFAVLFHSGKDPGPFTNDHALPPDLRKIREDFPTLRIIAAHMGGWKVWEDVEKILAGLDIYFDTAAIYKWLPPEDFVRLVRKHGVEKILFGSDSPWYDQKECVEWIKSSGLNDTELEAVFCGNAEKLLEL